MTAIEQAVLETIEEAPILERTIAWANINSGSGNIAGLASVAVQLANAFAALPGGVSLEKPELVEQIGPDGAPVQRCHGEHLVVRVRPEAERRILLTGHMDTVYPATDPFQRCQADGDRLHGPGTADMKGGLAIMLAGLAAFEASRPGLGYDVLVNSDEEIGSLSSHRLIAELAHRKVAALTYEPALPGGMAARARPGSGNLAIVVRGRSAHAGRNPQEGRNALVAAADLAVQFARAARPGLSINPARIDGGAPNNRVPDLAVLHLNLRPRLLEDQFAAERLIATLIEETSSHHEVTMEVHGGFTRPPKPITPQTQRLFAFVANASSDLDAPLDWVDSGGVCDGNNIAACGVPVIDTMGAIGGAIHSPDEWLSIPSLAARAGLTALVLHRLDQGILP